MSEVKERNLFYNHGPQKGFTRKVFYTQVAAALSGEEISEATADLIIATCNHELDNMANRYKRPPAEKKDPLASELAKAIMADIPQFMSNEFMTIEDIVDAATAAGCLTPKGKPHTALWTSRVLSAMDNVEKGQSIVTRTNKEGLKYETKRTSYRLKS